MKTSILLPAFKRPHLLNLGLASLQHFKPVVDYEILVLNDGVEDDTEYVCKKYEDSLNIKYIFTGQRNLDGNIKKRVPGFALNIGIKQAQGDAIILSCPEMYHLNNSIDMISKTLEQNQKCMVIPNFVYFDQSNIVTQNLLKQAAFDTNVNTSLLQGGNFGSCHCEMPYVFGLMKKELTNIGGYDEDFIGYAGEDCDLIERLKLNGLTYKKVEAEAIHLYHEGTNDGGYHWNNPDWLINWNLLQERKGIIVRNIGKEWGTIDGKK